MLSKQIFLALGLFSLLVAASPMPDSGISDAAALADGGMSDAAAMPKVSDSSDANDRPVVSDSREGTGAQDEGAASKMSSDNHNAENSDALSGSSGSTMDLTSAKPDEIHIGLNATSDGDKIGPIEVLYWPKGDRACKSESLSGTIIRGTAGCHNLRNAALSFHIGGPIGDIQIPKGYTLVGYAQKNCTGDPVLTLVGPSSAKLCYAIPKTRAAADSLQLLKASM